MSTVTGATMRATWRQSHPVPPSDMVIVAPSVGGRVVYSQPGRGRILARLTR
jgi:hypothetical protein